MTRPMMSSSEGDALAKEFQNMNLEKIENAQQVIIEYLLTTLHFSTTKAPLNLLYLQNAIKYLVRVHLK